MKHAVSATQASAAQPITRRAQGPTDCVRASTAMCTLARKTAAPPMKEKITISTTAAGSGQDCGLLSAYRMKTPNGMISVMATSAPPETAMQPR